MKYRLSSGGPELLDCSGRRAKAWPYAGYPEVFPTVPIYFEKPEPIDWEKLAEDEDWSGLTPQNSRPADNELLVVIPPNDAYGVSLWGRSGDRNNTQVLFRINLETFVLETWNECT